LIHNTIVAEEMDTGIFRSESDDTAWT